MIKVILILLCFISILKFGFGQNNSSGFHHNHIIPAYPGGLDSLESFVKNNLHYPTTAITDRLEGTVIVKFFVNQDGSLTDISIERGIRDDLNEASLSVILSMPKWNPGTLRIAYILPIVFSLNE